LSTFLGIFGQNPLFFGLFSLLSGSI
jgi:hypothetical protein